MQPQTLDNAAAEVLCQGSARAHSAAATLTFVALFALGFAWWGRDKVAAAGHQLPWSLVCVLLATLHGMVIFALIPTGCLARDDLSVMVGSLAPWLLAAALVRSGVAPLPPSLRGDGAP